MPRALPGREGLRRARRRPDLLRGLRRRRADDAVPADLVDRALAALEGADPVSRAPLPGRDLRRPRQRALGPPAGAGGVRRGRVRRRTRSPSWTRPETERAVSSASRTAPSGRCSSRPSIRSGSGAVFIGPAVPRGAAAAGARRRTTFDDELDTDEGWAKYNRHYWLRDYRGFVEFFFFAALHRAALDEADRGRVGWALETERRDADRDAGRPGLDPGGGARALPRAFAVPSS